MQNNTKIKIIQKINNTKHYMKIKENCWGKNGKLNGLLLTIFLVTIFSLLLTSVHAAPIGPTAAVLGNETKMLLKQLELTQQ